MTTEKTIAIIAGKTGILFESISLEDSIDSLGLDSLDYLDLMLDLEEESGIEISLEQRARFVTVGDIAEAFGEVKVLH